MDRPATPARSTASGLHRRDLGQDQHDPAAGPSAHRPASLGQSAHGHWKTTTLIAALDVQGVRCSTVVDGAVNSETFEAFVQQVLIKQLKSGDVVMLDNLSNHKRATTRQMIESVGAKLVFLPPYSPDLNPIELVFSKLKGLLRTRACRTRESLWKMMQSMLDRITATDAQNCFRHCGYRYSWNKDALAFQWLEFLFQRPLPIFARVAISLLRIYHADYATNRG